MRIHRSHVGRERDAQVGGMCVRGPESKQRDQDDDSGDSFQDARLSLKFRYRLRQAYRTKSPMLLRNERSR
jgi:hypothetical protein